MGTPRKGHQAGGGRSFVKLVFLFFVLPRFALLEHIFAVLPRFALLEHIFAVLPR